MIKAGPSPQKTPSCRRNRCNTRREKKGFSVLGMRMIRRKKAQIKKKKMRDVYLSSIRNQFLKNQSPICSVSTLEIVHCVSWKAGLPWRWELYFLEQARKPRVTEDRPWRSRLLSCCLCLCSSSSRSFSSICLPRRTLGKVELVRAAAGPLE